MNDSPNPQTGKGRGEVIDREGRELYGQGERKTEQTAMYTRHERARERPKDRGGGGRGAHDTVQDQETRTAMDPNNGRDALRRAHGRT